MTLMRLRRPRHLVGALLGCFAVATGVVLLSSSGREAASNSVVAPAGSRRRAPTLTGALLAGGMGTVRFGGKPVVVDLLGEQTAARFRQVVRIIEREGDGRL